MPQELDFEHLRNCIDHYTAERLFIRDCGGYDSNGNYRMHGLTKVNENLENRTLDFRKDTSGLYLLIDAEEVVHFSLRDRRGGFTLAYERVEPTGRMIALSHGVDPYDPKLLEPRRSVLRHMIDDHLVEISFKGRIDLTFHSWCQEPHWKYWTIDLSKNST